MIRLAKLVGVAMTEGGGRATCSATLIAPRLHRVPGLRHRLLDGETPRLRSSALVHPAAGCGARWPASCAPTPCWPTAAGSTT